MGQGQRSMANFWCAAVDNRGSALPRAAKSNNHHYQLKVIVGVSVISGRVRIIAQMRSIGFFFYQTPQGAALEYVKQRPRVWKN